MGRANARVLKFFFFFSKNALICNFFSLTKSWKEKGYEGKLNRKPSFFQAPSSRKSFSERKIESKRRVRPRVQDAGTQLERGL